MELQSLHDTRALHGLTRTSTTLLAMIDTAPAATPMLSREQLREVDRLAIEEFGLPGVVLMENAGRAAADLVHRLWPGAGVVCIVCGRGNNAGDGFVMARHLELLGRRVRLLLAAEPAGLTGDAAVHFSVAHKAAIPVVNLAAATAATWLEELSAAAVVVDALLGTGASGPPRGGIAVAIEAINAWRGRDPAAGRRVFAVDLPSGLDCDTGATPGGCVRADATGTFVAWKQGFADLRARSFTGSVSVLGIGAPRRLLSAFGIGTAPPPTDRT